MRVGKFTYRSGFDGVQIEPGQVPLTQVCRSPDEIESVIEMLKSDLDALKPVVKSALERELQKVAFDDG